METIKKIIHSKWFIPVLVFSFISLLIWYAGPYISFADYSPLADVSNRLVTIIFILLIYVLVNLFQYHRNNKLQQKMVADMSDDGGVDEVINAESAELKRKFDQAFSLLKTSKGGPDSLISMPWYMIIGSPGSGKTTLLSNSGLKFPLFNEFSNQAIQGVGGTKNCDWWITQEAVLLDTAGRYTSRDSHQKADESGWNNFLGLIKKYRRKPISGLLVSFSMSDVVTMNEYEMGQQLILIKQRIAEINDYFETRFPVYLIITKTDMLAGFSQFYETYSHKEREQTFGITFDAADSENGDLLASFSGEFNRLTQSITRRQWQRISLERDASRKSLIYSFSDQFASLKPVLNNILESLTQKDNKLSTGIIRGMYFTSGTQQGAPIDRMIAKVAQTFGLKNNAQVLWNNDQRSYFIKELLQQVIFPESDQFGVLAGYEKRKRLFKRVSMIAAGVFSIAFCLGWLISYNNNVSYIESSEASVVNWNKQYKSQGAGSGSGDIRHYLPALNDFSTNLTALVKQKEASFSGLGLAQSNNLEVEFSASYNRLLKTILLPYVQEQAEFQLKATKNASDKYQALKAYLMLKNVDNRDNEFLIKWLQNSLKQNTIFTATEHIQLGAHVEHLVQNKMSVDSLDPKLIQTTQQGLQSESLANIYYQQFKQPYLNAPKQMLSMAQLAGPDWRLLMATSLDEFQTISRLFTPAMFTQVLTTDLSQYISQLNKESWLLGENNSINKRTLAKELEKAYARDYVKSWQLVLSSISIKPSESLPNLESALMVTSTVDSPLMLLLDKVSTATLLTEDGSASKLADFASKISSKFAKAQQFSDLRSNDSPEIFITTQFSKIHELMREERKALVQQRLSAIISELALSLTVNFNNPASENSGQILKSLQAFAYSQPQPLNLWLNQLSNSVVNIKNKVNKAKMAQSWRQNIVPQCDSIIAYKYPFAKTAKPDVSLRELSTLFANTGKMHQFYAHNIKPLIVSESYPWRWKSNVAENYGFSEKVLPFFEKWHRIQDNLFAGGSGAIPRINLSLKPLYLDSRLAKFKMSLYGRQMSYQFGRPVTTRITWPPENPDSGSRFHFVRRDGSEVISREEGLFSIFKLFDKADINTVNANKVEVTFTKENYKAIYELSAGERVDPMVISRLSNFKCLSDL